MPKITYVKAAQQRYEMVPVLGEDGQPVRTEVAGRETRHGRQVTRRQSRPDLDKPLPPYTCDYCREPIAIGTPYKHMSPKSGPYGGRKLTRHQGCPTWQVWDYSSSLSARLAEVAYNFDRAVDDATDTSEVESAVSEAADAIRDIAGEKQESSSAIEEGFQHETQQSMELAEQAEQLEEWAGEIENTPVPDFPEPEETDCEECDGTGKENPDPDDTEQEREARDDCGECSGTGSVTPDEATEDQVDEWREEVRNEFSVVSEPPV